MVKKKTCIFISGNGSNLNNLIKKSRDYVFPISVNLVISDNPSAGGIKYARKNSIPFILINTKTRSYENKILQNLRKYKISIIRLAGFMKILSKKFLSDFKNEVLNIHPSLLPKFKGLNTYFRIIKNKEKKTGCTVHLVNEKLDGGRIIVQKSFFISENDNEKKLKFKTQRLEYAAYPEAIIKLFRNINS